MPMAETKNEFVFLLFNVVKSFTIALKISHERHLKL